MNRAYIGDGVYVEQDDDTHDIVLTTERSSSAGIRTEKIVLEYSVWRNLNMWLAETKPDWRAK